jgi:ubiquinone/menaquinone biosynthesis C-methylase UbiE
MEADMSRPVNPSGQDERWVSAEAAAAYRRTETMRVQALAEATEAMLDLAAVCPGARVLDVAAGAGGQTLVAARRVGPTGLVMATDISAAMLASAEEAAQRASLTNVAIRVVDVENLDLEPRSFDAAICRIALMLFPDPQKALATIRRMLKPDGRFAALVFAAPEKNPVFALGSAIIRQRGHLPTPAPREPDTFALGDPSVFQETLERAGFGDVVVHTLPLTYRFESLVDVMAMQKNLNYLRDLMAQLPEAEHDSTWAEVEQAWRSFEQPTGFNIPGAVLLGGGTN